MIKGDTLWDLAIKNKTTVATLKKLDKLKSDTIYPGQILKLK
ncbi:LysM peptidoglycan-binding domain-containing protein [Sporolactobacillus shoreicorticis]|nr:LysM peptidoglycan-binding domain-containing protein [Sporolactobacillus shoreicorticis]MCO7128264.1 LysM peptidoglycan-binding domain-containing protein [Sporolactobacillus shoreicorticis]